MQKRLSTAALAVAALLAAVPAPAQTLAGPAALPAGATREFSLHATSGSISPGFYASRGLAVGYRRTDGFRLGARAVMNESVLGAEVETFGALPFVGARVGGFDVQWTAGLGYLNGSDIGLYLPLGIGVSRAFDVFGATLTPYLQQRVALRNLDQLGGDIRPTAFTDAGLDVALTLRLSLRAGLTNAALGSTQNTFGIGITLRR